MLITNETDKTFVLNRGVTIYPGVEDFTVPDELYEADTLLNDELDALESQGKIAITGDRASLTITNGPPAATMILRAVSAGADANDITVVAGYENQPDTANSTADIVVEGTDIIITLGTEGFAAEVLGAAATLVKGAGNARITFTAPTGADGNDIHIAALQSIVADTPDSVQTVGDIITITLGADGLGDPLASTATAIAAMVSLDTALTAAATPGTGASPFLAFADTPLAGGVDHVAQVNAHQVSSFDDVALLIQGYSPASDLVTTGDDATNWNACLFPLMETSNLSAGQVRPADPFTGSTSEGGRAEYRKVITGDLLAATPDEGGLWHFDMGLTIPANGGLIDDTFVIVAEAFPDDYQMYFVGYSDNEFPDEPDFTFNETYALDTVQTAEESIDQVTFDPSGEVTLPLRLMLVVTPGSDPPVSGLVTIWTGAWV